MYEERSFQLNGLTPLASKASAHGSMLGKVACLPLDTASLHSRHLLHLDPMYESKKEVCSLIRTPFTVMKLKLIFREVTQPFCRAHVDIWLANCLQLGLLPSHQEINVCSKQIYLIVAIT